MKMVLVDWVDSHSEDGWKELSDIKANALIKNRLSCQTAGFLIMEQADFVLIGMSRTIPVPKEEDMFTQTIQIPKCAIASIKEIKPL